MGSEDKFWLWFWAIITISVCVLTITISHFYIKQTKLFVENGYCETMVIGSNQARWVKCGK